MNENFEELHEEEIEEEEEEEEIEEEEEEEEEIEEEEEEIFNLLHKADEYIAETRQNTMRLGIETRLMLNDLRRQLG